MQKRQKSLGGEMVEKYLIEDASVEPMVTLVAHDNWIDYTIRYVIDHKRRRTTKDLLFEKILEAAESSKGKIQLASATFELTAAPTVNVKLQK